VGTVPYHSRRQSRVKTYRSCRKHESLSLHDVVFFFFRLLLYPARSRWGTYRGMLFQEGRSSNLRLRRGVGQAAHTRNNPHVKCIGVYCAYTVNNVVTSELYGVQLLGYWIPS